jgi:uridine phosphorylase
MKAQDLHFEKINLINWITRLQDEAVLSKLLKIQSKEDDIDFPSMSVQEMIEQADIAENEINTGQTTSHDDFYKEFKKW